MPAEITRIFERVLPTREGDLKPFTAEFDLHPEQLRGLADAKAAAIEGLRSGGS